MIMMQRRTDDEIKHAVLNELSWDTRTWDQKISVEVSCGVVTLEGTVASYGQKVAAETAAHNVAGVLDVANELFVKHPQSHSDFQIARAVRQALRWSALFPHDRIMTTVTDGWVKLEGKVNSLTERSDAEWAVENLVGVVGVINELVVEPPTTDTDALRESIERALERRADREAERLRIDVKDGEVTLFGRVHSWPERKAVVGAISHAHGVSKINDNLQIDPYF
jgi:osmotically-inducible protein OsmY